MAEIELLVLRSTNNVLRLRTKWTGGTVLNLGRILEFPPTFFASELHVESIVVNLKPFCLKEVFWHGLRVVNYYFRDVALRLTSDGVLPFEWSV